MCPTTAQTGNSATCAAYWVMPLFNFVTNWPMPEASGLEAHPMRPWLVPGAAERVAASEDERAVRERVIPFSFDGRPAFVGPRPDYEQSARLLRERTEARLVTAVAVGEVGGHDTNRLVDWFPLDIHEALGLATGVRIGSPYVEFHDAEGRFLWRDRINFGHPVFKEARATIDGRLHGGIGELLTCYLAKPVAERTFLKATMHHAVQGGAISMATEDRLASLFREFETVCAGLESVRGVQGLRTQDLASALDAENRNLVDHTLREAADRIRNAARRTRDGGHGEQANALDAIVDKVHNAKNREKKFGLQLSTLLRLLRLHDEGVANGHLLAAGTAGPQQSWAQLVSWCRGAVIHEGFLDVYGAHDEAEIDDLVLHTHDLLLRVVLKLIGYEGTYQPPTSMSLDSRTLDWVTPDTDPLTLGYGQHREP